MKKPLAILLLLSLVVGCGDPNQKANELFVEAVQLIESAETKSDEEAIKDYEKALSNVQKIIDDYSKSDLAVKLISGETLFTGSTLADIKRKLALAQKQLAQKQLAQKQLAQKQLDVYAAEVRPEVGPHQGQLVELGHEEYHAEWTFDNSSGKVTVYLLDADTKKAVPSETDKISVKVMRGDTATDYDIPAINMSDEDPPTTSQYELIDTVLLELLKTVGHGVKATLTAVINGQEYTGSFEHLPHH